MTDRILTTHVGSLPRPKDVSDMLFAREAGQDVDPAAFDAAVAAAVRDVVAKQRAAGVGHSQRRRDEQDQLRHLHH